MQSARGVTNIPNWVSTTMNVKGSKTELQRFQKFAKTEKIKDGVGEVFDVNILDMNNFIQYPKEFEEQDRKAREHETKMQNLKEKAKTDKTAKKELEQIETLAKLNDESAYHMTDGYNNGGYDWCSNNWGTKWNFCDVSVSKKSKKEISYVFQTAWSFPIPIALKMSEMFPTLEFEWCSEEESHMFNVIITFKDGEKINKVDVPFEDDEEDEEEE